MIARGFVEGRAGECDLIEGFEGRVITMLKLAVVVAKLRIY